MNEPTNTVSAILVPERQRLSILPRFFGFTQMVRAEVLVFAYMSKLSIDYTGGYWHYYTLSNGGFYMAPDIDKLLRIEWYGNQFSGLLTADAAGLVATMFAVSHLGTEVDADAMAELYGQLRDFAFYHPESKEINAAID